MLTMQVQTPNARLAVSLIRMLWSFRTSVRIVHDDGCVTILNCDDDCLVGEYVRSDDKLISGC